jgi:hypothetical protein
VYELAQEQTANLGPTKMVYRADLVKFGARKRKFCPFVANRGYSAVFYLNDAVNWGYGGEVKKSAVATYAALPAQHLGGRVVFVARRLNPDIPLTINVHALIL